MENNKALAVKVATVVFAAIKEAGKDGIISGHLYAALMGQGITLNSYNMLLDILKEGKLIKERNHVLTVF